MVGSPILDVSQNKPTDVHPGLLKKPYDNSAQMLQDAQWVVVVDAIAAHELRQPYAPVTMGPGIVFFKVVHIAKGQDSWHTLPQSPMNQTRQQAHYSGEGATAKYAGTIAFQHAFNAPELKNLTPIKYSAFWAINQAQAALEGDGKPNNWVRYLTYPAQLVDVVHGLPEVKTLYLDETRPFPYQRYATAGAGRSEGRGVGVDLPYVMLGERYVMVLDAQGYAQNRITFGAPRVEHVGTNNRWINWVSKSLTHELIHPIVPPLF